MPLKQDKIIMAGAGLVGSLLALLLGKKGFQVEVYEKRKDPRNAEVAEGRSINLALSHRGIRPLKLAGIFDRIESLLIPMKGRMMHSEKGELTFQPYGKEGQHIHSVPRSALNERLIQAAEEEGVVFCFDQKCESVDFEASEIQLADQKVKGNLIVGSDGAFSVIRKQMQFTDRFNYAQHYIEHGYKELNIEPVNGQFVLDPNYLHIWPRGNFMLIALPNFDKTFTCTLFFPYKGKPSFDTVKGNQAIQSFFDQYFKDIVPLIPNLMDQYRQNPTSSLVTISCEPWYNNRTLIMGDSAHAMVPFYGQGMNSGFEGTRLFVERAESLNYDWDLVLPQFANARKKDADAISKLALHNFIEMRNHVGNHDFLKRKKLEVELQSKYPKDWLPLYSMVTFSDIPYSEALAMGKLQTQVINEFVGSGKEFDYSEVIGRFNNLKKDVRISGQ